MARNGRQVRYGEAVDPTMDDNFVSDMNGQYMPLGFGFNETPVNWPQHMHTTPTTMFSTMPRPNQQQSVQYEQCNGNGYSEHLMAYGNMPSMLDSSYYETPQYANFAHANSDLLHTNLKLYSLYSDGNGDGASMADAGGLHTADAAPAMTTQYATNTHFLNGAHAEQRQVQQPPTLIENLVGNWAPAPNGTYAPFGHVEPLNNHAASNVVFDHDANSIRQNTQQLQIGKPFNGDTGYIATSTSRPNSGQPSTVNMVAPDTSVNDIRNGNHSSSDSVVDNGQSASKLPNGNVKKARIVAEVKPMRPSYSAVLTKPVPTFASVRVPPSKQTDAKDPKPKKDATGKRTAKQERDKKGGSCGGGGGGMHSQKFIVGGGGTMHLNGGAGGATTVGGAAVGSGTSYSGDFFGATTNRDLHDKNTPPSSSFNAAPLRHTAAGVGAHNGLNNNNNNIGQYKVPFRGAQFPRKWISLDSLSSDNDDDDDDDDGDDNNDDDVVVVDDDGHNYSTTNKENNDQLRKRRTDEQIKNTRNCQKRPFGNKLHDLLHCNDDQCEDEMMTSGGNDQTGSAFVRNNVKKLAAKPSANRGGRGGGGDTSDRPPGKRNQRLRKREHQPYFGSVISSLIGQKCRHYLRGWWKICVVFCLWLLTLVSDICSLSLHIGRDLSSVFWCWLCARTDRGWRLTRKVRFLYWMWRKTIGRFWSRTRDGGDHYDAETEFDFDFDDGGFEHLDGSGRRKYDRSNGDSTSSSSNRRTTTDSHNNHGTGLRTNISLPTTGEEAMKRLLACEGKDPYSILGVVPTCTDDDIKRYYKRQAFLVHPDKNQQPGAEEAFKILVHAFVRIGRPELRAAYDKGVEESTQAEQAWTELSDLLAQLQKKVEAAANTIRCSACGARHKRIKMSRPVYAARNCTTCKIHHAAREGDIWAEARYFGFLWNYYACMEGGVYDITDWAGCHKENLKHLKPDSHQVQYRIALGKQSPTSSSSGGLPSYGGVGVHSNRKSSGGGNRSSSSSTHDSKIPVDLEKLLNSIYGATAAAAANSSNTSNAAPAAGTATNSTTTTTHNHSGNHKRRHKKNK